MTLHAIDKRIAHIRRIVSREFGVLYKIIEAPPGSIITRRHLMRAESKIRAALTEREDKA